MKIELFEHKNSNLNKTKLSTGEKKQIYSLSYSVNLIMRNTFKNENRTTILHVSRTFQNTKFKHYDWENLIHVTYISHNVSEMRKTYNVCTSLLRRRTNLKCFGQLLTLVGQCPMS